MPSFPQQLGQVLADQVRKKLESRMPPLMDPSRGMDNTHELPPLPQVQPQPYVPALRGNSVVIPLPANKGANFEGYANFNWNASHPLDLRMNDLGIRYRYSF